MTEEEQIESIKKWWNQYGNIITIILSIVLLAFAGYRYWNWQHDKVTQQASIAYENMMIAFSNQNTTGVNSYANELINNYQNTVYADAAHLTLAKLFVNANKLDQAKDELNKVAKSSKISTLQQIAKIRMARIMTTEKAYTNALDEINTIVDTTYSPIINELKGDIYAETGRYKEALSAYRLAIDGDKNNGMGNLFLQMKTNELSTKSQSMISENKNTEAS